MNILEAIGNGILHILWQSAIVYGIVMLIYRRFSTNHSLAYKLMLSAQAFIFLLFIANVAYFFNNAFAYVTVRSFGRLHTADFMPYVALLYFIVLFVLIVRAVYETYSVKNTIRKSAQLTNPEWIRFTQKMVADLKITQKVRFITGNLYQSPFTKGFWKPVVYLPVSMFTYLTPQQIEAVILHELAHIKRYDYLIILCQIFIEKILYFNPFIQLMGNIARKEREILCDRIVTDQYAKSTYADALFLIAQKNDIQKNVAAATGNSPNELLDRIKIIHNIQPAKPAIKLWSLIIGILSTLLVYINLDYNKNIFQAENTVHTETIQEDMLQPSLLPAKTTEATVLVPANKTCNKNTPKEKVIKSNKYKVINNQSIAKKEIPEKKHKPVIDAPLPDLTFASLEIIADNNSPKLAAAFNQVEKLLRNEKLKYQVHNISNIQTSEGTFFNNSQYLITENYVVEIEQNDFQTIITLAHNDNATANNIN